MWWELVWYLAEKQLSHRWINVKKNNVGMCYIPERISGLREKWAQ